MVYFESIKRDGPGRVGILNTGEKKIETPCLLDEKASINELGSLWDPEIEKDSEITIFPSKRCPNYVPEDLAEYFGSQNLENLDYLNKKKGICSPVIGGGKSMNLRELFTKKSFKTEVLTLETLKTLNIQNKLLEVFTAVKEGSEENTAIFAPGITSPINLSFLVYLGVDLFDTTLAKIDSSRGKYYTEDEIKDLENLNELPCLCPVCSNNELEEIISKEKKKKIDLLKKHNLNILKLEIRKIKDFIRNQRFREYLERKIKSSPYITAALRRLDKNYFRYLEKRTPTFKQNKLLANTIESLSRPEIERFRNRVLNRYIPPRSKVAILLPCSAKKPYSQSKTHKIISSSLKGVGDQFILTSPLGLVPRELELTYPAQHYDIPVTGEWYKEEKKIIKNMLKRFFSKYNYQKIVIHLNNELKEISKDILSKLDKKFVCTSEKKDPRSKKSLKKLNNQLKGFKSFNRKSEIIKAIINYQFGITGEKFLKNTSIKGNYPRLKIFQDEKQLGAIAPFYGSLSLTIQGAKKIDATEYTIKIGDFRPKGSILAPGVLEASDKIRPNDEVIFKGKKAFGVGRSKMSGFEMEESDRGISVQTRHVKEL